MESAIGKVRRWDSLFLVGDELHWICGGVGECGACKNEVKRTLDNSGRGVN